MRLVLVRWVDAATADHGWRPIAEVRKTTMSHCQTVGWVLKQNKKCITLVSTICNEGDCDGDITIPMGMVKEIIPLAKKPA